MSAFSEFHDELRGVARKVFSDSAPSNHRGDASPPIAWDVLAGTGWLGLEVPEALGGAGATFAETAIVLAEHGRAAATSSLAGTVLGVGVLSAASPGAQRDGILRRVAAGEVRLAVAIGEGASFRFDGERLSGVADLVLDAPDADVVLVPVVPVADGVPVVPGVPGGGGPVIVVLDRGLLTVEPVAVLDASRRFGRVTAGEVPVETVLPLLGGDRSLGGAASTIDLIHDRAAVMVACDSLGLAEAMLEATVDYAGRRHQFNRPIGSFQAVKHACADMHVQITVGRELVDAASEAIATAAPDAGVAAAMAKSYACDAAVAVAGGAMQLHGGIGYTWESGVHVYLKRAVLNRALFGTPAEHRRRLAERYRERAL